MHQRVRGWNNSSTTEEHDSFPFPIEPLRSIPPNTHKRLSTHSNDSGITSPLASSRTPVLSPAIPIETSTPHPSTSQHAQVAQPSPEGHFSPIQQFIRNSATRMSKIASNCAPKSPNKTTNSQITPILNQYWELEADSAINFDPFYHYHAFRNFHTLVLLWNNTFTWLSIPLVAISFMATTLQRRTNNHSGSSMYFCGQFLTLFASIFDKKLQKSQKKFSFVVQFQEKKPYSKRRQKTI